MKTQTFTTGEFAPVERVNAQAQRRLLILCDHAANRVPPELGDLGLPAADFQRHIAYDVGAYGVARGAAERLDATLVASRFSRLVIDPNRGETDPTLIMRLYDRTIIPGNARIDADEKARRKALYYTPYHRAVAEERARLTAANGAPPLILSIHSFTRQLRGRDPRPWQVGVLWDRDPKTAHRLLDLLRADADLCVGDNEPYRGSLPGDTIDRHTAEDGAPHALIELRQDVVETPAGQAAWADRLAQIAERLLAE